MEFRNVAECEQHDCYIVPHAAGNQLEVRPLRYCFFVKNVVSQYFVVHGQQACFIVTQTTGTVLEVRLIPDYFLQYFTVRGSTLAIPCRRQRALELKSVRFEIYYASRCIFL